MGRDSASVHSSVLIPQEEGARKDVCIHHRPSQGYSILGVNVTKNLSKARALTGNVNLLTSTEEHPKGTTSLG